MTKILPLPYFLGGSGRPRELLYSWVWGYNVLRPLGVTYTARCAIWCCNPFAGAGKSAKLRRGNNLATTNERASGHLLSVSACLGQRRVALEAIFGGFTLPCSAVPPLWHLGVMYISCMLSVWAATATSGVYYVV